MELCGIDDRNILNAVSASSPAEWFSHSTDSSKSIPLAFVVVLFVCFYHMYLASNNTVFDL